MLLYHYTSGKFIYWIFSYIEVGFQVFDIYIIEVTCHINNNLKVCLACDIYILNTTKQIALIVGQTGCPYWGTNRLL